MTQAEPVEQAGLQYIRTPGGCDCPIHRDGDPITAPLGLRFPERVHIEPIPQHVAGAIYDAHHSSMDDVPRTNLVHHGLCYQDHLVGAITWRHPLIRALNYDETRYQGDEIVEAARVCIGVDFPNLASATLARSMERNSSLSASPSRLSSVAPAAHRSRHRTSTHSTAGIRTRGCRNRRRSVDEAKPARSLNQQSLEIGSLDVG